MGVIRIADSCQRFPDANPLSPTALNILRDNLIALEEASRLGGYIFCGLYGQHPEEAAEQYQIIWRGGGIYRSGVTTLRIITYTTGTIVSGDTLRIYRGDLDANGAPPATYSDATLTTGTQTHTVSLSGYSDGDAIRVALEVRHAAKPPDAYTNCLVDVVLAELTPYSTTDAAPTLPTFGATSDLTATKLNQMADYVDWLIRRVAVRYDPLWIIQIRRIGPNCLPDLPGTGTDPNVAWYGGVRVSPLHTTLTVKGNTMRVWGGATESVRLLINGSVVDSEAVPTTIGESAWTLTADLSGYPTDTVVRVKVDYVRTAPRVDGQPVNRWTISEAYVAPATGGTTALGEWEVRQASVAASTVLTWVQTARTIASNVASRISGNAALWGHQRLYTARPGMSAGEALSQFTLFEEWAIPMTWRRAGDAIEGRGRALSVGYGAAFTDDAAYRRSVDSGEGVGAWPLKHTRNETLVDGDNVETFRAFLDGFPALPPGAPLFIRGVESWVLMERLKVVEG